MRDEYWGKGSLLGVGALLRIWMLQACLLEGFLCGLELAKLRVSPILRFEKHIDSLTRIVEWLEKLAQPPAVSESRVPSKKNFLSVFSPWAFPAVLLKDTRVSILFDFSLVNCWPKQQYPLCDLDMM